MSMMLEKCTTGFDTYSFCFKHMCASFSYSFAERASDDCPCGSSLTSGWKKKKTWSKKRSWYSMSYLPKWVLVIQWLYVAWYFLYETVPCTFLAFDIKEKIMGEYVFGFRLTCVSQKIPSLKGILRTPLYKFISRGAGTAHSECQNQVFSEQILAVLTWDTLSPVLLSADVVKLPLLSTNK